MGLFDSLNSHGVLPLAPRTSAHSGTSVEAALQNSTFNTERQSASAPLFMDRLRAGLLGFANANGPIPAIVNLVTGLATGQRIDPSALHQQTQLETYNALRASGLSNVHARAATLNPEVLRIIAPAYFGGWKIVKTGENSGGKQFMMQGPGGQLRPLDEFIKERLDAVEETSSGGRLAGNKAVLSD
jgi:hypothetical protein